MVSTVVSTPRGHLRTTTVVRTTVCYCNTTVEYYYYHAQCFYYSAEFQSMTSSYDVPLPVPSPTFLQKSSTVQKLYFNFRLLLYCTVQYYNTVQKLYSNFRLLQYCTVLYYYAALLQYCTTTIYAYYSRLLLLY